MEGVGAARPARSNAGRRTWGSTAPVAPESLPPPPPHNFLSESGRERRAKLSRGARAARRVVAQQAVLAASADLMLLYNPMLYRPIVAHLFKARARVRHRDAA